MSDNYIKNVVEAALLAAGRPLQLTELAQLFEESSRPEPAVLRAALDALEADYGSRGIEVKETATGFRIQVKRDVANEVSRLWPERPPRYSRALLETLALIAYRQPITRAEIEAVRGVAVNPNIIKTVLERNWVRVVGTRDVPGRPELLGTTKEFLDYFGLRALDELPPLAELKAMGEINLQLDLAKPTDPSDDGSQGSNGAGGGEGTNGAGNESGGSAVAAAGAVAAIGVVSAIGAVDAETADPSADAVAEVSYAAADAVAETSDAVAVADAVTDASDAVAAADAVTDASDAVAAADAVTDASAACAAADAVTGTSDAVAAADAVADASDAVAAVDAVTDASDAVPEASAIEAVDAPSEPFSAEASASAALASANEGPNADAAATHYNAESELDTSDAAVAFEHEPVTTALTHVEVESDSADVTVEVEALRIVEDGIEATLESDDATPESPIDTSIETGEFEMAELGLTNKPAPVIEAEFDADDLDTVSSDDEAADDDEELSAGPHSSTELVAAPRDRDD